MMRRLKIIDNFILMYDVSYNYSVPVLFEIVIEGKLKRFLVEGGVN